MMFTTIR